MVLSYEYFAQLPLHCGGAENDEKHLRTLGGATVALEDTFSGLVIAERRVVVQHDYHRQVERCQHLDLKPISDSRLVTSSQVSLFASVIIETLQLLRYPVIAIILGSKIDGVTEKCFPLRNKGNGPGRNTCLKRLLEKLLTNRLCGGT